MGCWPKTPVSRPTTAVSVGAKGYDVARIEVNDAMVLAAARESEPHLFAHGLAPLPRDGPNTRRRMADGEARVRRMLDAALGVATQTDRHEGVDMTDDANAHDYQATIDKLMEQAQVFASAWSSIDGPFDNGAMLSTAEAEKTALRAQLVAALAAGSGGQNLPAMAPATPGARWRADGESDPHGTRYDCERAALALGDLSDEELANGAFLNYDAKLNVEAILRREPNYHSPIAWMTAVKDRIRWLSRRLEVAAASNSTWWRKRADEIEVEVARGMSAMACYTQMRQLVQAVAASPAASPAAQQTQPVFPAVVEGLLWLCTKVDGTMVPITTNGTTRMVPREEPVFLIRGQDSVGADAVRAWADFAEAAGAAPALLQSAREHAEKMDRWTKKKVADNAHPPASSAPMQRALALAQGVAPNAAAILATFCHELVMGFIEEGAVRAAAQRVLVAAGLSRLE